MKYSSTFRVFFLILCLTALQVLAYGEVANAQVIGADWQVLSVERVADEPDRICTLPVSEERVSTFIDPSFSSLSPRFDEEMHPVMLAESTSSQFEVTYDFYGRHELRSAFEEAAARWSRYIRSPIPISVSVSLEEQEQRTLAVARMAPRFLIRFADGNGQEREFLFPPALASYLSGEDLTPDEAHFSIAINPNHAWYFGTGTPGENQHDFISVVMHEIGHGLGIFGSMDIREGLGIWPGGLEQLGVPSYIYDGFATDGEGTLLLNTGVYPNPSGALRDALEGHSGGVRFAGEQTVRAEPHGPAHLYAPETWRVGRSYSHLDESTYPAGDPNSLMKPRFARGEVVRTPGALVCGMLSDMGWGMGDSCFELLGSYVLAFDAVAAPAGFEVSWSARADAEIDVFSVETMPRDISLSEQVYQPLATVGKGETTSEAGGRLHYRLEFGELPAGRHLLRIRALDADGRELEATPGQQITVPLQDYSYSISGVYPNPVSGRARIDVTVSQEDRITMQVFDSTGRRVLIQHRRVLPNIPTTFEWDASGMASGTYFVHLAGELFTETHPATVVR